jgi:hypothetical protein
LGVSDYEGAQRFYEALGWQVALDIQEGVGEDDLGDALKAKLGL